MVQGSMARVAAQFARSEPRKSTSTIETTSVIVFCADVQRIHSFNPGPKP